MKSSSSVSLPSCQDLYTSTTATTRQRRRNQRRNSRRSNDCSWSKKSFLRVLPIISIICILSTPFIATTADAFMSSTLSQTTRIATATTRSSKAVLSTQTQLGIAKSGGKMIDTEKQFADNVLSKDLSRPVLVFFSAPW